MRRQAARFPSWDIQILGWAASMLWLVSCDASGEGRVRFEDDPKGSEDAELRAHERAALAHYDSEGNSVLPLSQALGSTMSGERSPGFHLSTAGTQVLAALGPELMAAVQARGFEASFRYPPSSAGAGAFVPERLEAALRRRLGGQVEDATLTRLSYWPFWLQALWNGSSLVEDEALVAKSLRMKALEDGAPLVNDARLDSQMPHINNTSYISVLVTLEQPGTFYWPLSVDPALQAAQLKGIVAMRPLDHDPSQDETIYDEAQLEALLGHPHRAPQNAALWMTTSERETFLGRPGLATIHRGPIQAKESIPGARLLVRVDFERLPRSCVTPRREPVPSPARQNALSSSPGGSAISLP